ncbi:uncharacterized protein Tco025E_05315 [Trypanosoma conorhini]|uniref:Uncharacterized protein n=1 Tax=Trypanosoma conorhini TaxID=83891 RepID=A0A422PEA0_9TRYP|nr:uncharacterized protein Tco025E_05315 [Trypanosoma conorhini]RNF16034.1 hypothetical protein Tco025E_05315 [Trypanosoma conorhini]
MIPKLNVSALLDTSERARDRQGAVGGGRGEAVRTPQDARSSTPLRIRCTVKGVPRLARGGSSPQSRRPGAATKLEDGAAALDVSQRAEELSYVLGGNILQVQDVHALQLKAIEMAERLLLMEEWYKRQLRERSSYVEHRLMQLGAPRGGGGGGGDGAQVTPTAIDKSIVPRVIRGQQTPIGMTAGLGRTTLSVGAAASGRRAAAAAAPHTPNSSGGNRRTPDSSRGRLSRHCHATPLREIPSSSQAVASRHTPISRRPNRGGGLHSGSRPRKPGVERRKLRSASLNISLGSRGSSDTGVGQLLDDFPRRQRKRRSLGSSLLLTGTGTSNTPNRRRPASVRLGWTP